MKTRVFATGLLALVVSTGAWASDHGSPAEAQALLNKAIAKVAKDGQDKAIAAFNDAAGGFRDRDLYVFCMDGGNKIVAHPDASLRGTDVATLKDAKGKPFGGQMIAAAKKGSGTVEYSWKNPVSGKVEDKVSYLKTAGKGLACGVGAYK